MATAAATAASYSPLSGLYVNSPGLNPAAAARFTGATSKLFANPNAPTTNGAGALPAGVAGSIAGAGAFTPDWASLIQNDAGLKDASAALAAGGAQNQQQLDAELANAYENFGKNVDLAQLAQSLGMTQADLQSALGPDVQKLAQENTDAGLSTTSRLDQANQNATRQLVQNLNKRGILHSGEAGYELNQQNLSYRQAQSDAYQKFLGYLQQYQQGYLAAQQANAGKLADSYNSAADRVLQQNQSSPGVTAQFDHIDANGNPVYSDASGNLYGADGKPYQAPQATTYSNLGPSLPISGPSIFAFK